MQLQACVGVHRVHVKKPQASGLLTGTHWPPHECVPSGQPQRPALQVCVGGHTVPQVPQLNSSLPVFVHEPEQLVRPAAQFVVQTEVLQRRAHTVPQPPQFETFRVVSTHVPLHSVWFCPGRQPHAPFTHTWLEGHTLPQLPQLVRSHSGS